MAACADAQQAEQVERRTGAESSGDVTALRAARTPVATSDPAVRAADSLERDGRGWRATMAVAPALRTPTRRTPAARLVAARAAAQWDGWSEVERQLAGLDAPGLDAAMVGEVAELRARAALGVGRDADAVRHAELAMRAPGAAAVRGIRMTLLARALDRARQFDSAGAMYLRAAESLGGAGDWLRLRAAGVMRSEQERERIYEAVRLPAARARVGWTEALALERQGALAKAAATYERIGARAAAFRLRARDSAASVATLAGEAVALLRTDGPSEDVRDVVAVLDARQVALAPADELVVARAAGRVGLHARAAASFARAFAGNVGSDADRLLWAASLARAGRRQEAFAALARVGGASAGAAALRRARLQLEAGQGREARVSLQEVAARYAAEPAVAAPALLLLADLRTDDGRDADARAAFLEVARRYPSRREASEAAFQAAIVAMAHGDRRTAAREFDALVARWPAATEAVGATYWSGRAHAALGEMETARVRWRTTRERQPLSYYAMRAGRRLDEVPWSAPADGAPPAEAPEGVAAASARAALLEALGMDVEARFEYAALDSAVATPDAPLPLLLATARAFREAGLPSRASRLALRAIERGERNADSYRLAYPVVHRDALAQEAARRRLDPPFVAALIRQESNWNPRAVSPVGARGLMQVMPTVGEAVARSLAFPVWDRDLLFEPDANFSIGMAHLAAGLRQYRDEARALAAYNAGGSRVARWVRKPGAADPELFIERIPYDETRDYVRIVQRNAEVYRALYRW